jgi:hypothetical protein
MNKHVNTLIIEQKFHRTSQNTYVRESLQNVLGGWNNKALKGFR